MYSLIEDKEISSIEQDVFNRKHIAKAISESILNKIARNHACFTIGINAKWGEGKTSVLNMIKEQIKDQSSVIIVDFNPWMFRDQESMLMEFFNSIDGKNISENFVTALKEYGPIVTLGISRLIDLHTPGAGVIFNRSVSSFINRLPKFKENVNSRKAQLNKEIRRAGKHLVVFIDDVDRLDKEETHCLFKLIKQTADFDNTIFIVAMDKDVVAHSLCHKFENGDEISGYNFLEKIIQLQLYLPSFDKKQLAYYFDNKFSDLVATLEVNEGIKRELTEAQEAIHKYVMPLLTSPREIIQFINTLSYTLPPLLGEVNLSDLCLLESLKVICPFAYNTIRDHRHLFIDRRYDVHYLLIEFKTDDERKKKINDERKELMERCIHNSKPCQKYYLSTLIGTILSAYFFDGNGIINSGDQRRLCSKVYFDKYFQYETPLDVIDEKTIEKMVVKLETLPYSEIVEDFNQTIAIYGADELKRVLNQIIQNRKTNNITDKTVKNICISLALLPENKKRKYFTESNSNNWEFMIIDILNITNSHIERMEEVNNVKYIIQQIVKRANTLFGLFVIVEYYRRGNCTKYHSTLILVAYQQTQKYIAEKSLSDFFRLGQLCLEVLCKCWKEVAPDEYSNVTKNFIEDPKTDIISLVTTFVYNGEVKYLPLFTDLFDLEVVQNRLMQVCKENPELRSRNRDVDLVMSYYDSQKDNKKECS